MRNATTPKTPSFARLVQQFFTEYLVAQRSLSPCTVACYRDALILFLGFASRKLGEAPSALRLVDIQPDLILAFLDHLERERHNAVRSRNLRLTALRAFLKFAGRRDVSALLVVEQALAVPMKRSDRPMLGYLTREEMLAVLGQPGSASAAIWRALQCDRAVARAREHEYHTPLRRSRPRDEREGPRLEAPDTKLRRFRVSDSLMRFLQTL